MFRIVLCAALLAGSLAAEGQASVLAVSAACPVQFKDLDVSQPAYASFAEYMNTSGKPITAMKLSFAYVDKVGDEHPSLYNLITKGGNPGKKLWVAFYTDRFEYSKDYSTVVRITKIAYADGTVWTPPSGEDNPCSGRGR